MKRVDDALDHRLLDVGRIGHIEDLAVITGTQLDRVVAKRRRSGPGRSPGRSAVTRVTRDSTAIGASTKPKVQIASALSKCGESALNRLAQARSTPVDGIPGQFEVPRAVLENLLEDFAGL